MTRQRRTPKTRLIVVGGLALAAAAALSAQGGGGFVIQGGGGPAGGPPGVINTTPGTPLTPLPTGTSAISGVVTDGTAGRALANAVVTLRVAPTPTSGSTRIVGRQTTDPKGRFVFTDLAAAGTYMLDAAHAGYFDGAYGASEGSTNGSPILLGDGDWFSKADVAMWPTSAITGTVLDENNEPVVGAYVRALKRIFVAGSPHFAATTPALTDDRGLYRISGLDPGTYLVVVPSVQASVPPTAPIANTDLALDTTAASLARRIAGRYPIPPASPSGDMMYPPAFYPAATSPADAAPIEIRFGVDPVGIDVHLRAMAGWTVSGRVGGGLENVLQPPADLTLRLLPANGEDLSQGGEVATALMASDGSFTFFDVPSGDYVIEARTKSAGYTYQSPSAASPFQAMPPPPGLRGSGSSSESVASAPARIALQAFGVTNASGSGSTHVAVDGHDVTNVSLSLRPGATIEGRVVFDGGATPPTNASFASAESADGDPSLKRTQHLDSTNTNVPDSFSIPGVSEGDYVLRLPGFGRDWAVKSIVVNGRDYSDAPLPVAGDGDVTVVATMTSQAAKVGGTVRGADGAPAAGAAVILFSVKPSSWQRYGLTPDRIKTARANTAGVFQIAGVRAGDYYVVAVDSSQATAWQDPAFLERAAARASRVSCDWGETKTVDLTKVAAQ